MKEYMFPVNVTNEGAAEAEFGMESYLNGGVRLESEPARLKLKSGQTARVLVKLNPRRIADGDTVLVKAGSGEDTTRLNVTQMEDAGPCTLCNRGV